MNRQDLGKGFQSLNPDQVMKWLVWILVGAACAVAGTYYAYFQNFHSGLSEKHEVWGQFGDFIGESLNPILSFLSLIALILTVALQSKQMNIAREELENSKEELRATREELAKSAEAQRSTATALEAQARYAVISAQLQGLRAALDVTSESLRQARDAGILVGQEMYQELLSRKSAIATKIILITQDLCKSDTDKS